jgi:hypothetical protein
MIKDFFSISPSIYWTNHFRFDVESAESNKPFGAIAVQSLVINTIIPYLFFMSKHKLNHEYIDYALDLLTQLPYEVNTKTKEFIKLGIKPLNALESQAQIQLFDNYCTKKACLKCNVAEYLLKNSS